MTILIGALYCTNECMGNISHAVRTVEAFSHILKKCEFTFEMRIACLFAEIDRIRIVELFTFTVDVSWKYGPGIVYVHDNSDLNGLMIQFQQN